MVEFTWTCFLYSIYVDREIEEEWYYSAFLAVLFSPCRIRKVNDRIVGPNGAATDTRDVPDTQFMLSKIWHWHRMAKIAGIIIKVWRKKKRVLRKTLLLAFSLLSFILTYVLIHSLIQLHFRLSNGQTPHPQIVLSVSQIVYKTCVNVWVSFASFFLSSTLNLFYKFAHTLAIKSYSHIDDPTLAVTLNSSQKNTLTWKHMLRWIYIHILNFDLQKEEEEEGKTNVTTFELIMWV